MVDGHEKTDFFIILPFWLRSLFRHFFKISSMGPLIDQKIAGAKKLILTKNQFFHARQPHEGIFMAVFGNFDQLFLTH